MGISFVTPDAVKPARVRPAAKRKPTKAVAPVVSLDQPGRLRVANLMALLGISRPSVYARVADGRLPAADGNDGRPYWNTQTVRAYLQGGQS